MPHPEFSPMTEHKFSVFVIIVIALIITLYITRPAPLVWLGNRFLYGASSTAPAAPYSIGGQKTGGTKPGGAPSGSRTGSSGGFRGISMNVMPFRFGTSSFSFAAPGATSSGYLPSDIPAGFTAKDLSPYFHKIRLTSIMPGWFSSQEQLTLYNGSGQTVDVSGWRLDANRGGVYVPKAVGVYDPSGLAGEGDIRLKNGETLTLYSGSSAVGVNLHLNKCIGYLQNVNKFTPPLPLSCPAIDRSAISGFTGACQNYIESIGTCELPAPNPPVPQTDYGCQAFINNINYGGCFSAHRGDADFLSSQWWAWMGGQILDKNHDRVLLKDGSGLLVDEYDY